MKRKCAKPTCTRKEQNGGLCKPHYALATRGIPTGRVDCTPVIEHLKTLADLGVSNTQAGRMVGMPQNAIWAIANGRRKFILAATAAKILAIPIPHKAWLMAKDGAKIPAVGTARRLRALIAFGYTGRWIAARIGVHHRVIHMITSETQQYVTARKARVIAELFDELQLIPGPSKISRQRAAVKGWPVPMAWDEDDIDDPNAAEPEVETYEPATYVEQAEDMRYLGYQDEEIVVRLDLNKHQRGYLRDKARRAA